MDNRGEYAGTDAGARLLAEREALLRRLEAVDARLAGAGALQAPLEASWQAILDALPAHVALLDPQGRIVVVNAAWRRFGAANVFPGQAFGVGQDYLAVCERAQGDCTDEADAAARGIREVLAGRRAQFVLEYPCHSPAEQRWFRMMATPIHPSEPRGCVVMHVDVTERKLAEDSLRANEARLRAILDTEPECVKLLSPDGRLLSMNPAGLRMIEAEDFAQVAGRPVRDLLHPEDREAFSRMHRQVLGGESAHLQFRIVGLQGGERWMDTHATPMRGSDGRVEGVLAVTRDITERRATEVRLSRLRALHHGILASVADGIIGVDLQGRGLFANPAALAILGCREEDLVGRDAHALFHHSHADGRPYPAEDCAVRRTLEDGVPRRVDDECFFDAAGRPVAVEFAVSPMRGEDGAVVGAVQCFRDISGRLRDRDALARSEERFRLVARATANAIWDWDVRSGEVDWSGRLDTLFGFHPDDVRADRDFWSNHVHPDDLPRVQASLDDVLGGAADTWECEYRFRRRDGSHATVVDRGFVVRDGDGRALRMVGGMNDVTEVRALEAQLRASQRLEAVGQLTGGIAHDFNNLLTVVLGNAELLDERLPLASSEQQLAQMILSAAQRGSELTQRLLAFARRQALEVRLVELGALVRGMEHLVRRALGDHIELILHAPGDAWIQADAAQLESAVLNLCINARDAMPRQGRLSITVAQVRLAPPDIDPLARPEPGDYVRLEVRDTGCGIPDDVLPKVIEPFFTTKDTGKGTGLGLSMVYGLVKQSSGYLDIRSRPGRGTSVRIHLPLAVAPASDARAADQQADAEVVGGHEHVLLVEDDALVRRYAVAQLEGLGYRVTVADGGAQALRLLRDDGSIELMLTDVMMPGLNGPQLADAARRLRPGLPVLFSSGYSEDALASEGRLPPGVLLLAKPYQKAELGRRLRQALA
ncbi:MAG TPA: PAS domain S-box protein [Thermomonas sp.]|nr:PAS domain S-box protein [Thermomonas sp.]